MRHRVAGRKLGRVTSHKLATLRNLTTALFERDRIRTTLMKAKEMRPFAEKLVTLSKKGGLHRRRLAARHIHDPKVLRRLFADLSVRYTDRPGGYVRILKLGPRRGDGAEMALVEMVDAAPAKAAKPAAEKKAGKGAGAGKAAKPAGRAKKAARG
jgi:large subunit ribosomal protein L17